MEPRAPGKDEFRCASVLTSRSVVLLHLQFDLQSQLSRRPVGTLTGYQLTWFYFGYSRAYAVLLGLTQALCGSLLLFRKTTLLGALVMLPVMANILLINVFILVKDYEPFLISALICIFLLTLIWHQRSALMFLLWRSQQSEAAGSIRRHHWIRLGIVSLALTMMISGAIIQKHVQRSREQSFHSSAAKSHD
jgi:hypothetical protein